MLRLVATLRRIGFLTAGDLTLDVITDDPSDNRYLECTVEGRADYVVSGDEHLLKLREYERIRIVRPAEFLRALRGV